MELNEIYFVNKINRAVLPGGEPLLYVTMTSVLKDIMDTIPDNGAALISNLIKMSMIEDAVQFAARDGSVISVTLKNNEESEERQNELMSAFVNQIAVYAVRWYFDKPSEIMPIYESGLCHIPDSFAGHVHDMGMRYVVKECSYTLMMETATYDACIPYQSYIRCILKKAMHCNKVMFYDDGHAIIVVDKNTGSGTDIGRAHALACGIMFVVFGILNAISTHEAYKGPQ